MTNSNFEANDPGARRLQGFLDKHEIEAELRQLTTATPTVETAAVALGCLPSQIGKSILFLVEGKPVMAVTCGLLRVDPRTIARYYGVGRKKVKLANAETVLTVTGYQVGGVPPFGYPTPLPTLLDNNVLSHQDIWAGGGSNHAMLRIAPNQLVALTNPIMIDLHQVPEAGE